MDEKAHVVGNADQSGQDPLRYGDPSSPRSSDLATTTPSSVETGLVKQSLPTGSMADGEHEQLEEVGHGFCFYLAICFPIVFCIALQAILLWSSMGFGAEVYDVLVGAQVLRYVFAALAAIILFFLYMIDFFFPPHLPGQNFVFFDGDRFVGKAFMMLVFLFILLAVLFSIETSPGAPGTINVMLSPIIVFALRSRIAPKCLPQEDDPMESVVCKVRREVKKLRYTEAIERDAVRYFFAATVSFVVTGFITFLAWLVYGLEKTPWVMFGDAWTELQFLYWAAPGALGVSNLILGCIMGMRNSMAVSHTKSEACSLIAMGMETADNKDIYWASMAEEVGKDDTSVVKKSLTKEGLLTDAHQIGGEIQRHLAAIEKAHLESLSNTVKRVGCMFFLMVGIIWLGGSLLASESQLASAALMLTVMFFAVYVILLLVAFRRLLASMHESITQLPLFRLAIRMMDNDWARGAMVCATLPMLPCILLLSLLNQRVRSCRALPVGAQESIFDVFKKIASQEKESCRNRATCRSKSTSGERSMLVRPITRPDVDETAKGGKSLVMTPSTMEEELEQTALTGRIMHFLVTAQSWDISSILQKMYILCLLYVIYAVVPLALNIFLAWLISIIRNFQFGVICVSIIVVGLCCFLLPPVPGVPVYLFCGLLVASTWTNDPNDMGAFMTGAMIGIVLGFIMKLSACALQQKVIGEMLGNSLTIRQQVGVHKEMIRGIEMVLRTPGISLGKSCILCGGPDWPTSVLAGLLRLPLSQMLIGTLPVIVFVGPCSLTGSLYLKSGDGGLLSRLGSVMLLLTVGVNLLMWVGAAWAIQSTIDNNLQEIRMPLEKNIDLDWLDYRDEQVKKSCVLTWSMIPFGVKVPFVSGVVGIDLACQALFWAKSECLGSFSPSEDLRTIEWFNCDTCMLKVLGLAALAVAAVCFTGFVIFKCWNNRVRRKPQQLRGQELDAEESQWKANRLVHIRVAREALEIPESPGSCSTPETVNSKIVFVQSASRKLVDTE
eukprot:TRINITY_DN9656_c0_g1_i1.p1 TRINITY_DN9656_c0_g1~~TRINITY_DN9656_c0_g1_i1.p1  ORF type:complete len:1007 (+),score=120.48 TRINITY_DN9656_c0_g1_i1:63-3083(+)